LYFPVIFYETFEERPILSKFKEGENFNRRNTLKYFEDLNLSLTPKSGKRGRYAEVSFYIVAQQHLLST